MSLRKRFVTSYDGYFILCLKFFMFICFFVMSKLEKFFVILLLSFCFVVLICIIIINLQPVDKQVKIVTLDSCQYYSTPVYGGFVLTHKGNCINHE